jgi:GNAT superfamily N-acetyltransferase
MLTFAPISHFQPGALSDLIRRSYARLVQECSEHWKDEAKEWDDFDRQAFAHPGTIGTCVLISCLDDQPVGLASYDPRNEPEYGRVGQNCILPEFRGRGFGKQQILEVLRRLKGRRIRNARVTTSEHPFFLPARKMYEALGFKETRRFPGGPDPRYGIIELERPIILGRSFAQKKRISLAGEENKPKRGASV